MPAWSPNGQTIACGVFSPSDSSRRIVQVSIKDGSETALASPRWLTLIGMTWLPDGSGLLVAGRDLDTRLLQIWLISYPEGKPRRVTNDLSNYSGISLTADGRTIASVQGEQVCNIWVGAPGDSAGARRLTLEANKDEGRSGIALTSDGRIIYTARTLGIWDLWIVDRDGKNNHQLTFNTRGNYWPTVTPDGRYIVFVSLRAGSPNLWRMQLDGGNPKQLTFGSAMAAKPLVTPDSNWVIYESVGEGRKPSIWKVGIDGGDPIPLTEQYSERPSISTDGKSIAFESTEGSNPPSIQIISIDGGVATTVPDSTSIVRSNTFRWAPDGRGLVYIDSRDRVYNLWTQALNGGPPKQLTSFSSDQIFWFDLSGDGKTLAMARGHETSDVVLINSFE
jgi:Tol biopolymer transport system component